MRWGGVLVAGFAVSAMSCLAPTEIMLVLSTDVACAVVAQNGVAIALGDPGDEDSGIAATTKLCADDGGIGTLAVLPHDLDRPIGIRVTLGVDAGADACGPNFEGCIVARRSLRFDPHTTLTLPIDLDQACIGIPCTPNSTCVSGACVDAGVECDGSSCGVEDAGSADVVVDASPPPCETIADTLVASGTGQGAARVALSKDGWGVAYQTTLLGVELRDVHLVLDAPTVDPPITLVTSNNANVVGPLGGDGTSYAVSYTTGGTAHAAIVGNDGTPITGAFDFSNASPAAYGMFPLGQTNYATAFLNGTDGLVVPIGKLIGASGVGLNGTNVKDVALARGTTSFYATTADAAGKCSLYKCNYANGFTCAPSGTLLAAPCPAFRVAERAGTLSHVSQSGKVLTVDDTYNLPVLVFGSGLFDVIATSDLFHVVYAGIDEAGGATSIAVVSYDPTNATLPTTVPLSPPGGGYVLSVDVVPDGPNEPGYAIVYTTLDAKNATSVRFVHRCQ